LGVVGRRERWRLTLPPIDAEVPLAGWVSLSWEDRAEVRRLRGAERLRTLGSHRGSTLYPASPASLIDLSGLPVLQFCRPRRWDLADEAVHRLIDALC
ncbi:MAG TPA: hypothetical protein VE571_14435, partial [Solirubrobacteraceae bacterium]|nr:hypothetical protein [Solirubrobacteraceae bacterium]